MMMINEWRINFIPHLFSFFLFMRDEDEEEEEEGDDLSHGTIS